jgi:hypothetical protein
MPSSTALSVVVGVLGDYMGMIGVPADTSEFPNKDQFRWGQFYLLRSPYHFEIPFGNYCSKCREGRRPRPLGDDGLCRLVSSPSTGRDALLYLGPAASLTQSPITPDLYLDFAFRGEIDRRSPIVSGAAPLEITKPLMSPTFVRSACRRQNRSALIVAATHGAT